MYQDDGAALTDASTYLSGLIEDLNDSVSDRPITLSAESVILPSVRLAPLGLITSELVTNSLKYGAGAIEVTLLRASDEALLLSVEDEGPGLPDAFPRPQGTGLGMRLVRSYAGFGSNSVQVDRSVPWSRITVSFKAV